MGAIDNSLHLIFMKLQFVEIVNDKANRVYLEESEHIVGHKGDIVPKLCNGHISRKHVKVVKIDEGWEVFDGVETPSRNGLYFQDRGNSKLARVVKSILLTSIGQKVYLLNISGSEAYLEVVPNEENPNCRDTTGLELQIAELDVVVSQNKGAIKELREINNELTCKVGLALETIEKVGKHPRQYLVGTVTLAGMLMLAMGVWLTYTHLDRLINTLLYKQEKIERKIESVK